LLHYKALKMCADLETLHCRSYPKKSEGFGSVCDTAQRVT
jgi:hypothetical protein